MIFGENPPEKGGALASHGNRMPKASSQKFPPPLECVLKHIKKKVLDLKRKALAPWSLLVLSNKMIKR